MKGSKPYCLMPWIHFHIGDDGMAKACCVANIPYGNINTSSFDEIWYGKKIENLRTKFAKGELDKRCAQCYKLEAAGGKSIRQETFEKFPEQNVLESPIVMPIYFDIRFSNVCNLKCRTCWHGASSSWFEDSKKLGTNKGEKAIIKNIQDFQQFITQLGPALLQAKEIYIAGGEPLVTQEHYLLLEWLIDNKATNIKLRYNTNFTKLKFKNHEVLPLWNQFKHIEILASIDAVDQLGAYIRSGTDWEIIVANYNEIKKLTHISFKIAPTISVLNVSELPDLFAKCLELQMITEDEMYINILERPLHYNIQILPIEAKLKIKNRLANYSASLNSIKAKSQFQEIINYMNSKDQSKHWPKFQLENGKIDTIRNERLP
jgi:MoaA/NifB/PqqE/SkfB family radical SAM enzyme